MRVVPLEAVTWGSALDFLVALKSALNAPPCCGDSPDAINELMVWGLDPQVLEPPYEIQISGLDRAPKEVQEYVALTIECVNRARQEYNVRNGGDIDVSFKVVE
jgi:hypothetical protein